MTRVKICNNHTVTNSRLSLLRRFLDLPTRQRYQPEKPAPTPAQISVRAAAIRAQWTTNIEMERRVLKSRGVTTQEIDISHETQEHYWEERGGDT